MFPCPGFTHHPVLGSPLVSLLPYLDSHPPSCIVIYNNGAMMLDLGESKNKHQQSKLTFALSPLRYRRAATVLCPWGKPKDKWKKYSGVLYKSGTRSNKLINCYLPVLPSWPPSPSHLRLKLPQPLSTNVRFSFEKRKANTQQKMPFSSHLYLPPLTLGPLPPVLRCDSKGKNDVK